MPWKGKYRTQKTFFSLWVRGRRGIVLHAIIWEMPVREGEGNPISPLGGRAERQVTSQNAPLPNIQPFVFRTILCAREKLGRRGNCALHGVLHVGVSMVGGGGVGWTNWEQWWREGGKRVVVGGLVVCKEEGDESAKLLASREKGRVRDSTNLEETQYK